MRSSAGLRAFVLSTVLIAAAYGAAFLPGGAPRWAPLLLATGSVGTMVSVMVMGAARPGRTLGALGPVFGAVFVLLAAAFALALLLPPETAGSALWLGLPRRAAILIYGIGLLPVVLLPVAYAATFDRVTLSDADLARFREQLAAQARESGREAERRSA